MWALLACTSINWMAWHTAPMMLLSLTRKVRPVVSSSKAIEQGRHRDLDDTSGAVDVEEDDLATLPHNWSPSYLDAGRSELPRDALATPGEEGELWEAADRYRLLHSAIRGPIRGVCPLMVQGPLGKDRVPPDPRQPAVRQPARAWSPERLHRLV